MQRSSVEYFLRMWETGINRIFRYPRPLLPDEYIIFKKNYWDAETHYEPNIEFSTFKELKVLDEEEMTLVLCRGEYVFIKDWSWTVDVITLKTLGCVCGAWSVKPSERIHARWCPLHKED